jgi:hypothetical protein
MIALDARRKVVYSMTETSTARITNDMDFDFTPQRTPQPAAPTPPNAFFDGTRLGLEGTMLSTLGIGVPAGLHIALSATLGYATRLDNLSQQEPKAFTLMGFIFISILALVAMAMVLFFLLAIPTMAYSMLLVATMLQWMRKFRGREKVVPAIVGAILGLLVGVGTSALIFLLSSVSPTPASYGAIFRWPEILTIDGIILLWFTLNPLANAAAGVQIGWRLGVILDQMTMYWFF